VLYPYIRRPDYFVIMSGEGYDKYKDELAEEGTLIYESDLVTPDPAKKQRAFGVPSTRIAEELGRVIVQNIVMLGFMTGVTGIVEPDLMRQAVADSVPEGTEKLNLKAFDAGYEHWRSTCGGGTQEEAGVTATPAGSE
jgi:2-oxoglutarate ferredoxin oxidoreductase subunit gamma